MSLQLARYRVVICNAVGVCRQPLRHLIFIDVMTKLGRILTAGILAACVESICVICWLSGGVLGGPIVFWPCLGLLYPSIFIWHSFSSSIESELLSLFILFLIAFFQFFLISWIIINRKDRPKEKQP